MRSLTSSIAMLLILSPLSRHAAAQETPTEREAARAVVQKMDSVERILNVPALVARLTAPNAPRDAVAARAKELMDAELLALGDDITRHPEVGFVETRSVQLLIEHLKKHDFDVQLGAGGLKTAFVAKYTKSSGAGRRAPFTATNTRRRGRSASPPPSPSPNTSRGPRRRGRWSCSARRERR